MSRERSDVTRDRRGTRCRSDTPAGRCACRPCAASSRRLSPPFHRGRQAGFTLIEVIAAILLLAIAFAALMRVGSGAIALSRNAAAHDEAGLWARSLLDSAYVTEPVQAGSRSGHFNAHYRWVLQVTPWQSPGSKSGQGGLQLYRLDLAVRWGNPVHPQVAHFDTLRLGRATAPGAPSP